MRHISLSPETFEIITFRLPFFYQDAEDAINLFLFCRAYKPSVESWMFYSKYLRENTQHKNVSPLIFGMSRPGFITVLVMILQHVYCVNCRF